MARNVTVSYISVGFQTARQFWTECALPAVERFAASPTRASMLETSVHLWHTHDWHWHDKYPGHDTRGDPSYPQFKTELTARCPELAWVRDIADAGKHRGLGRAAAVHSTHPGGAAVPVMVSSGQLLMVRPGVVIGVQVPPYLELTDGSRHNIQNVFTIVAAFWDQELAPS